MCPHTSLSFSFWLLLDVECTQLFFFITFFPFEQEKKNLLRYWFGHDYQAEVASVTDTFAKVCESLSAINLMRKKAPRQINERPCDTIRKWVFVFCSQQVYYGAMSHTMFIICSSGLMSVLPSQASLWITGKVNGSDRVIKSFASHNYLNSFYGYPCSDDLA
jgi:hypothetical protein